MPYGDKCTRCGSCCRAIPCGIGLFVCGDHRPCKALECVDGKYQCGLVVKASNYMNLGKRSKWKDDFLRELFSNMLGVGMGCCSSPEGKILHREMLKRLGKNRRHATHEKTKNS